MLGALARHGAVVLRDRIEDDAALVELLSAIGEPMFTDGETALAHAPTLNVVSNVGRSTPPRSVFHTDSSYFARPPAVTALRAVEVPARGGDTLITDQVRALETLPFALRELIEERDALHVSSGLPDSAGPQPETWHPLVRRHPLTGAHALFVSNPPRMSAVRGLAPERAAALVDALHRHSTRPENVRRHRWRTGDVLLIDDRTTLHRADHSAVVGRRVLHRGLVRGEAPLAARAPRLTAPASLDPASLGAVSTASVSTALL